MVCSCIVPYSDRFNVLKGVRTKISPCADFKSENLVLDT